jgi:hypothetical protein
VKKAQAEHEAKLAQEAKEQSEEAETNNTAE